MLVSGSRRCCRCCLGHGGQWMLVVVVVFLEIVQEEVPLQGQSKYQHDPQKELKKPWEMLPGRIPVVGHWQLIAAGPERLGRCS